MPFRIIRNDITKMETQAIVNTANRLPVVGAGCDEAIYKAAGYDELLQYRKEHIGIIEEGNSFITPGFQLKCQYIIHTVSPLYQNGNNDEETKLRNCYKNSFKLAKEHDITSIAFPLISTGSFLFPKEEGMQIAIDEINRFLLQNEMEVYLVVYDERSNELAKKIFPDLKSFIQKVQSSTLLRMNSSVIEAEYEEECFEEECLFNPDELKDRIYHVSDTFSEYLLDLIKEKGLSNVEVYTKALVDKKVFSKIKNDSEYHPNKFTALSLCIGARLNLEETEELLTRAGYALNPSDITDIVFQYYIEKQKYNMIDILIYLDECGIPVKVA